MSSGPHGFKEEDFLRFFHYKSIGANDPRGVASLGTQGLDWQDMYETTKHCYILNI